MMSALDNRVKKTVSTFSFENGFNKFVGQAYIKGVVYLSGAMLYKIVFFTNYLNTVDGIVENITYGMCFGWCLFIIGITTVGYIKPTKVVVVSTTLTYLALYYFASTLLNF